MHPLKFVLAWLETIRRYRSFLELHSRTVLQLNNQRSIFQPLEAVRSQTDLRRHYLHLCANAFSLAAIVGTSLSGFYIDKIIHANNIILISIQRWGSRCRLSPPPTWLVVGFISSFFPATGSRIIQEELDCLGQCPSVLDFSVSVLHHTWFTWSGNFRLQQSLMINLGQVCWSRETSSEESWFWFKEGSK